MFYLCCTGGTCGINGTWAPQGCSGLLWATLGCSVLLRAALGVQLCKYTPGCTGGTCGIHGTCVKPWHVMGCPWLPWAALNYFGLFGAAQGCPGSAAVQIHTWLCWGHMWHLWHLCQTWVPTTCTCIHIFVAWPATPTKIFIIKYFANILQKYG